MKRLYQKMLRDIWKSKAQFISILIMCFMGILIYTGIEGVWNGMDSQIKQYHTESNLADLWINGLHFDESDLSEILKLQDVEDGERSGIISANIENSSDTEIRLITKKSDKISKLYSVEGKGYKKGENGIWINASYAEQMNVDINDKITLYYNENKITVPVEGIVYGSEYVSYIGNSSSIMPDEKKYTYGYVSDNIIESLTGRVQYNQIQLKLTDDYDELKLKTEIRNISKNNYIGSLNRSHYIGVANYMNKVNQIKKMSIMFSIVFLLLALLTIQTTMKRIIKKQRAQIGILKALGFYSWQIYIHYSLYGFIISITGALAGYFIAPYTVTPLLLDLQKEFYDIPVWKGETSNTSIILVVLMIAVCTYTAFKACQKVVRELPASSLRDESPKIGNKLWVENINFLWENLSFDWKWILRDVFQNKSRTIVGVIGVVGSITLLMSSFGIKDSVGKVNKEIYGIQYSYYQKIEIAQNMSDEEKQNAENILQGDFQWISENSAEVRTKNLIKYCKIDVIDEGYYMTLKNEADEIIQLPDNGVVISDELAKELGVSENEYVKINQLTNTYVVRIDKIIKNNTPQAIFVSSKYWETLGGVVVPTALLIGDNPNADKIKENHYSKAVYTLNSQLEEADGVLMSVQAIIILLIAAAILLSVVILYNLGILSYTERSREYATLRVLGFYNNEIKSLIFKDSLFNIVIGLIIGVPCGFQFLKIYVNAVSTSTIRYSAFLSIISLTIALIITIGCSLIIGYLVSQKVKEIDMVEALKSVE